MARINIEDEWWIDVRRTKLTKLLNGDSQKADGLFFQSIRMAQKYCNKLLPLSTHGITVPWSEAQWLEGIEHLIECGLVTIIQANAKQTPSKAKELIEKAKEDRATYDELQVYVCGTNESLEWLKKRREAGSKGGTKSSKRPRTEQGTFQANAKQNEANDKQNQPSYSSSSSPSYSFSSSC